MVHVGTWLSAVDSAILRAMDETGYKLTPAVILENTDIDVHPDHITRRARKLDRAGIISKVEGTRMYEMTELGEAILNNELSREEIQELEPED